MKDVFIIGAACVLAIGIGVWLYTADGAHLPKGTPGPVAYTILEEGQNSGSLTERANYRISSQEELEELYALLFIGEERSVPTIDFSQEEVLVVVDGVHPTGGYGVSVVAVEDTAVARTLVLRRSAPGESCITTQAQTSPYLLLRVPATRLPIERIEQMEVVSCE